MIQNQNVMKAVVSLCLLGVLASCSPSNKEESSNLPEVKSYPYKMDTVSQKLELNLVEILTTNPEITGDTPVKDIPFETDFKEQWGDLAPYDLNDTKGQYLIREALQEHIDTDQNKGLFYFKALQSVLNNSQPQTEILSRGVAVDLALTPLAGTTNEGPFILVDRAELMKRFLALNLNVKQMLEIEHKSAQPAIDASLEDMRLISSALLKQFKGIQGRLPPEPYDTLLYINGFLAGLDPHSRMVSAKTLNQGDTTVVGIGIKLELRGSSALIDEAVDGGGAADAGVLAGDVIESVDDWNVDLKSFELDEVVKRIKGDEGTTVVLGIKRKEQHLKLPVVRRKVVFKNLTSKDLDGITHIRVGGFNRTLGSEMTDLLTQKNPKSVILDLRGNPGGEVDQAISVLKAFIRNTSEQAVSIWYVFSKMTALSGIFSDERSLRPAATAQFNGPMVVLLDERSASASELVSSNFKHLNRALVIGKTSFGKGSMQAVSGATNNVKGEPKLYIAVTTGLYFTALSYTPQFQGVTPSVVVEKNPDAPAVAGRLEKDLVGALKVREGQKPFNYEPSEAIKSATTCVENQLEALKAEFRKTYAEGGVADLQLLTAEAGIRCQTN